jgi:hypothetical protein
MVEELMRCLTIVHSQVDRVAIEDFTIGGQPIHPGDFLVMTFPPGTGILISSMTQKSSTSTETPADTWVSATAYIGVSGKISRESKCRSRSPRWPGACLS